MKGLIHKNGEGYRDPTAAAAIREADRIPENVTWFIGTIKSMADLFDFEIIGRIQIKDKKTGREYR